MAKHDEDLQDVSFIFNDLLRFAAMTSDKRKRHLEEHPEDKMHCVDMRGHHPISREAARRFSHLAKRQRAIDPDEHTIDLSTLDRAIRAAFVEMFLIKRRPIERKWIDRMLNRAVREAKKRHEAVTHYLPCVIMTKGKPPEFRVGPVRFIATEKFFADYQSKIEADHKAANERQRQELEQMILEGKYTADRKMSDEESARYEQMVLNWIYEYYRDFVWIAEVGIPACDAKISRERAEITVQAALDVLKLFFGHAEGRDFRLAHDRGRPEKTADLTRGSDGAFCYLIHQSGEGAHVEKGWYDHIAQRMGWALEAAGSALEGYLKPDVISDHRDRWLGALNWYGQAVSERLPSAQLIKYVAALERLTVTEETETDKDKVKVTDVVTRRTALLSVESYDAAVLSDAWKDARKLYGWRSDLMHGRSSPLKKEFFSVIPLAHRRVQQALFGALALYVDLEMTGKRTSKDLEERLLELEKELPTEATKTMSSAPDIVKLDSAVDELKAAEKKIRSKTARLHLWRAVALVNEVQKSVKP